MGCLPWIVAMLVANLSATLLNYTHDDGTYAQDPKFWTVAALTLGSGFGVHFLIVLLQRAGEQAEARKKREAEKLLAEKRAAERRQAEAARQKRLAQIQALSAQGHIIEKPSDAEVICANGHHHTLATFVYRWQEHSVYYPQEYQEYGTEGRYHLVDLPPVPEVINHQKVACPTCKTVIWRFLQPRLNEYVACDNCKYWWRSAQKVSGGLRQCPVCHLT